MTNLDYEKELIRQEKFIDKLNSMSPKDRQKFMSKLAIRMRLDSAKMKDLKSEQRRLNNVPRTRTMSTEHEVGSFLIHLFGTVLGGAALFGNSADKFQMREDVLGFLGTVGGLVLGAGFGLLNQEMYKKKPIGNVITDIKKHITGKKINKLSEVQEKNNRIIEGVVPFEAQGDYPDMEAY